MQTRDIAISTIGMLDMLVGGIAMMFPEAVLWWAGLFFAMSGIVLLALLWVPIGIRIALGNPYILSRRLPLSLAEWRDWYAFKPYIFFSDIIDMTKTNYQASGGVVNTCNIFMDFTVMGNHKIGKTRLDFSKAVLTLSQKRGGISYDFTFHPLLNAPSEAIMDIGDVGVVHFKHLTYSSDKTGNRKEEAPNLELESIYEIKGIEVKLSGPLIVNRTMKPLKGRLIGKLE